MKSWPLGLLACLSIQVQAETRFHLDIPAGSLAQSLVKLSDATGAEIGGAGSGLGATQVKPLVGYFSVAHALDRILEGTGLAAQRLPYGAWRIERTTATPKPRIAGKAPASTGQDIIVAASKRSLSLEHFPGAVAIVDVTDGGADQAPAGTDAIVARNAVISSTALGAGRNKLFIRGIADSGFTGSSPVATAQYLDDVRLTYNMPDPGLDLYDVRSVEILEGPRGTLYGAGTLGGVVRIVANPPDTTRLAASLSGGGAWTSHGSPGRDGAAMVNIPVARDLAVRAVGYDVLDGGYIDEPARGRVDTNRVSTLGGRLALRWTAVPGWMVDVRGVAQNIHGRDSQWSNGPDTLDRDGPLGQPYSSDFRSGSVIVAHNEGDVRLISATSLSHQTLNENYDARDFYGGTDASVFGQRRQADLIVHETRLFQSHPDGTGWLVGMGLLSNRSDTRRGEWDGAGAPLWSQDLRATIFEATLFGEASVALPAGFIAVAGGRFSHTHLSDRAAGSGGGGSVLSRLASKPLGDDTRTQSHLLPSAALSRTLGRLFLFMRFDASERPGGLSIENGVAEHFDGDRLKTVEAGLRWGRTTDRLRGSLVASHTRWRHVQADLVTEGGAPVVINIGNATIMGLEAAAQWHPSPKLGFDVSVFSNRTKLRNPSVSIMVVASSDLPNVARYGASASANLDLLMGDKRMTLDARLRYFGPSRLGIGPVLGRLQGDYLDNEITARWGRDDAGVSLRITNLFNLIGNRFALGTPFRLFVPQATPLRPRTIRLGTDLRF